jgi:flagellar biosynthesis protein
MPMRKSGKAVALRYWAGLPAPFLSAKAEGRAALRFVEIAKEAGVPVVEDASLADAVFPLDLGEYVPEECFEIVAKVFAFVASIEDV